MDIEIKKSRVESIHESCDKMNDYVNSVSTYLGYMRDKLFEIVTLNGGEYDTVEFLDGINGEITEMEKLLFNIVSDVAGFRSNVPGEPVEGELDVQI